MKFSFAQMPKERHLQVAAKGGHVTASRHDMAASAKNARDARDAKARAIVDPNGDLPEEEVQRRLAHYRKVWSINANEARRAKRAAKKAATPTAATANG